LEEIHSLGWGDLLRKRKLRTSIPICDPLRPLRLCDKSSFQFFSFSAFQFLLRKHADFGDAAESEGAGEGVHNS
jgi:hypothetical protein